MTKLSQPSGIPSKQNLLTQLAPIPGVYHEPFSPQGEILKHWRGLSETLDNEGWDGLARKQKHLMRMHREDAATYDLFNEAESRSAPWNLDLLPLPISIDDWAIIETGIKQRCQLFEMILQDIYGPQKLVESGQIPAEFLYANPHFLHQCHDIQPSGGRFLSLYAADIYRDANGVFRVWRDYGSHPAGLGFALENRIILSRVLSDLYQESNVLRLAPFFQKLHQSLSGNAEFRQQDPDIVILSPGPDSDLYFEHALLSRYLGYPLVESQDLTVRNGKVYLKKLAGLEQVEVVLRFLSDGLSDPFALRKATAMGVAGLIQASREKSVGVVNQIGSGIIDSPVMSVFLPELCRSLKGEELLLKPHPSWWCGKNDDMNYITLNRDALLLHRAMEREEEQENISTEQILAAPHLYMASERLSPSTSPTWNDNHVGNTHNLIRVFCCGFKNDVEVMPGGLGLGAPDPTELHYGKLQKLQSRDIWVIAEKPIKPFSLLEELETVTEFRRGSDLPSRVADNLLWLGRYFERAEGTIRLLRAVYRRLAGEAKPNELSELPFLLKILQSKHIIHSDKNGAESTPHYGKLVVQLHDAMFKREVNGSVVNTLQNVRKTARNVRDRLSLDCWRIIGRLDEFSDGQREDPLDHLDETLFILSSFSGLAMESMTRGLGWRFMDMGRRMERAINLANLLHIGIHLKCVVSRSNLEALLEIADSIMTYRSRYRTTFQLAPALDLLVADEGNPKSLAFQLSQLAAHVEQLPQLTPNRFDAIEERLALEMLTSVRLLDLKDILNCEEAFDNQPLLLFIEKLKQNLNDFARNITAHYLSRVPTTPHYSMINDG